MEIICSKKTNAIQHFDGSRHLTTCGVDAADISRNPLSFRKRPEAKPSEMIIHAGQLVNGELLNTNRTFFHSATVRSPDSGTFR